MPPKTKKISPRFVLFWMAALLLELPFVTSFLSWNDATLDWGKTTLLVTHLMSALTLFFAFPKDKGWFHHGRYWPRLFFFLVLFLPFFGILISLFLFLGYQPLDQREEIFAEDKIFFQRESLFDGIVTSRSLEEKASRAIDITPLSDILEGGDIELKRGAIEKLALMESPEAIKILVNHSSDPSPEVRFYITSTLNRIKKSIDDSLEAAKEEMKNNVYKVSARIFLSRIYLRYAQSNLLDETSSKNCLNEAIHHLNFAIQSDHKHKEAYLMLIDIHQQQRNWEKVFETALMMEEQSVVSMSEIIKIKLEYFYNTRQFKVFYKELHNLIKLSDKDANWTAMANWWGVSQ